MIDDQATWISTYKDLPPVDDSSWTTEFSNWIYDRVKNAELSGIGTASAPFNFQKSVFEAQLSLLPPTLDQLTGITGFATAWQTAINASTTLNVVAGDYVGSPTPATIWSVVSSALLDTASIAAGYAIVLSLATSPPVTDPELSDFPVKMRDAFLALTGTISGLNSLTPPTGPTPLIAAAVALI